MINSTIKILNCDCMEYMANLDNNSFDLAIVDPPYGIGVNSMNMGSRKTIKPTDKKWDDDIPNEIYFDELKRVSVNQIIWGGNYFPKIWPSRGFIVWDKGNSMYGRSFSECELAYMSIDTSARIFKMSPNDKSRIHPTQKPIKLYEWILRKYAKPGQNILDTHLGSGSSAIAAHYFGCNFVGCEIDFDYYNSAKNRFKISTAQIRLYEDEI